MNKKARLGVIIGPVLGILVVLSFAYFLLRRKMKGKRTLTSPPATPLGLVDTLSPSAYIERSLSQPGQASLLGRRAKYLSSAENRTFLTFLSSYGSGGISLRELIMLVTLRHAERESKNHWLVNGEVGTFEDATNGVVDSSAIESFQELLESLGFIEVKYPKGTQSAEASQYWYTDGRVWIVRVNESNEPLAPINDFAVLQDLLDLLIAMPDKDVSPTARRHREVYYYHAHLLIFRVIRSHGLLRQHPFLLLQAVFVVLQLLTHRYGRGDSLLLDFVRRNDPVSSLYPNWNVMLLWAELKEKNFQEDYDGLCTVRDRAFNLVNEVQSQAAPRLNGLLGFLLVDLMQSAKAFHFEDIVADAVKAGTKLANTAQTAHRNCTSIEKIALCEILATFNIHARTDIIQEKYYLFYGFHLSRAGFLVRGDQFLARVLNNRDSVPLWSYEMERVSNSLRLGRQYEAGQMLKSIRQLALHNRDKGPYSIVWKHSGECAETFILLYLYGADHSASAGKLDDACAMIKAGISITSSVFDTYIQVLRVSLKMRLLEMRMCQGLLKEALHVALDLASEVLSQRTRVTLAPNPIYVIMHQCLDLSNTLLAKGDAVASLALLKSITSMGTHLPGDEFQELKSHVEQRIGKARQLSKIDERSKQGPTTETLKTGVEDLTQVQTNTSSEMTFPQRRKTTVPTYASLNPHSSYQNLSSLSEPTHMQSLAKKDKGGGKHPSSKGYRSKPHASTLGKILRAPRPPSTQPENFAGGSGEKASQREGLPSQAEFRSTVAMPQMP